MPYNTLEKRQAQRKRRRDRLKQAGLCHSCGSKPRRSNRTLCKTCAKKEFVRELIRRESRNKQGLCSVCGKGTVVKGRKSCQNCLDSSKYSRDKRRTIVLYSIGTECHCCGETKEEFLTLTHINGEGAQDRRNRGSQNGVLSYLYNLIQNDKPIPNGYGIECYNCNLSREHKGYCPHEKQKV